MAELRFTLTLALILVAASSARARDLGAEPVGPRSLRAALAEARDGDRILVAAGRHTETPYLVTRRIELIGARGAILDARGQGEIVVVRADGVSIRNLELRGAGQSHTSDNAALRIEDSRDCLVEGNTVTDSFFGIYLSRVDGCAILRNEVSGSAEREVTAGNAIHLWNSSRVTIGENKLRGQRDGIYLEFVKDSLVEKNESAKNLRYGLHFMFSDSCSYERNVFTENGAGVAVMYTRGIRMAENIFADNRGPASYGLLLKDIRDSSLEGNIFRNNSTAMMIEGSSRLAVRNNEVIGNGWGIKLMASSTENVFSGNNFIGNAFDVSTNGSESRNDLTGNYWDAYRGYDLDRDGSGDVPHHPVSLFSVLVEKDPSLLILLRSLFVEALDAAERVFPILTPEAFADGKPVMTRIRW